MAHLREQLAQANRKWEEKEALSLQASTKSESSLSALRSEYERSRGNHEQRQQALMEQLLESRTELARKAAEVSGLLRELEGVKEVGGCG